MHLAAPLIAWLLAGIALAGCTAQPAAEPASAAPPGLARAADPAAVASAWTPETPGGLEPVAQAEAPGGYALRVWADRAYVATFTSEEGVAVFGVADPAQPRHLGGLLGQFARSVDVLPSGARVAVAISTGNDLQVWDLTDPGAPAQLASLGFPSHNVVAHREAGIIYNARNLWDDPVGGMEIVDARDLDAIHLDHVWTFPPQAVDGSPIVSTGCHDLSVWPGAKRAYCAAYQETLVLDISDPWNPVVLHAIAHPLITDHHTAFPILDHAALVVGDEFAANFAWGCFAHPLPPLPGAPRAPDTPLGALWFYDLTTPTPQVMGWVGAPPTLPDPADPLPLTGALCTSHNGEELLGHAGEGTGLVAYGWFRAGVVLIDARDPAHPVLLDRDDVGGAVGDARWHRGHVLAVDDQVGLTALALV